VKQEPTGLSLRVDQAIRGAGLRNEDVAAQIETKGKGAVQHWRSGRNEPMYDDLRRLAAVTGRSLYWLVTGRPDPADPWLCLSDSLGAFRTGMKDGRSSVEVWEKILERRLSDEEREAVNVDPEGLRDYLAGSAEQDWAVLDDEERQAISRLVHLLQRNKRAVPPSPERTSE
jgi:transcriptional regulator with XRE-family HTH domain